MEEKNESKNIISLTENINNSNNYNSRMIKNNQDEAEELQIISEEQNNQINFKKEMDYTNDKKKTYFPSLTINKEFDFKYDTPLKQILPVGLKNLGKSCFMNSCLQCFYHCSQFTSEILDNYQKYENMKCPVLLCYLEVLKNLYTNGKESSKRKIISLRENNENEYESTYCCCRKRRVNNNEVNYCRNETNPASAKELYLYILKNYSNLTHKNGSDPKIVAEMILSAMNREIDSNFKYIRDKEIPKSNEALLFNHIFNYYKNNKTVVSSNFYWIKESISICNECGKETYNFQSDYIFYFYPEAIINGLNLKIDNNKYKLSLENCFEYFHTSGQLDINSFTCKLCNKRVKAKSILDYMATLPKYLVLCLCNDKDVVNPINYTFDYNKEINLEKYYRKHPQNNYSTKYKFHCGCYSTSNYFHMVAFCVHFDGLIYEFNDSFYKENNFLNSSEKDTWDKPYLLIYKRDDHSSINISK